MQVPQEPEDLRKTALEKAKSPEWSFMERWSVYNTYVLSAWGLPKYLWDAWKEELRSKGVSWQLFLKAISACEHDVHSWIEGRLSWRELVENVIIPVVERASRGAYPLWPPRER